MNASKGRLKRLSGCEICQLMQLGVKREVSPRMALTIKSRTRKERRRENDFAVRDSETL